MKDLSREPAYTPVDDSDAARPHQHMQELEVEISSSSNGSMGEALALGQVVIDIEEGSSEANAMNTQSLQVKAEGYLGCLVL